MKNSLKSLLETRKKRSPLNVHIEADILASIKSLAKKHKLTLRDITEYSLKKFIEECEQIERNENEVQKNKV